MTFGVRTATLAATLAVLPVGLTGCGGDDPQQRSAPSSTTTTTAPATKPTASAPAAGAGALTTASFLPATKRAVAGKDTVRMSMTMVAMGQTMTMTGVARLDAKDPAMSIEMNGAAVGGTAKFILVDDKLYAALPGKTPKGKFLKLDADGSGDATVKALRETLDGMDPNKTFRAFDKGLKKVTFVAKETVDGEQLDHYKVTVDTKAALAAEGEKMTADMPKTIVYDIWLDSAKLMRQVVFVMDPVKATLKASDYGKPVTIKAPPAKDVITR